MSCGTGGYNDCTESLEEYIGKVKAHGRGDVELFEREKQPAYINKNCYLNDAPVFDREADYYRSKTDPHVQIVTENKETYLEITVEPEMLNLDTWVFATEDLGLRACLYNLR